MSSRCFLVSQLVTGVQFDTLLFCDLLTYRALLSIYVSLFTVLVRGALGRCPATGPQQHATSESSDSKRADTQLAHSFHGALPTAFSVRSWSEYQIPTKCTIEQACPGYSSAPGSGASFVDTQACAAGYESVRCATCSAGYYQLNARCYFCGSSVDQSAAIATTVVIGVAVMMLLALAVSMLSSHQLARAVQIFSLLQGAASVGVAGARNSPYFGEELHEGMTYLNSSQWAERALLMRIIAAWMLIPVAALVGASVVVSVTSQFRHRGDQAGLRRRADLHIYQ